MLKRLGLFLMLSFFFPILLASSAPDNAAWFVKGKSCDGEEQEVHTQDRLFLKPVFLAQAYRLSEDAEKICTQVDGFTRITTSIVAREDGIYEEHLILRPLTQRTQCRSKATGDVISNDVFDFNGPEQTMMLLFNTEKGTGTADIEGSRVCLEGILHLALEEKNLRYKHKGLQHKFINKINLP